MAPQSKRHCCASIATTEHSGGAVNGGPEAGTPTAVDGDIDGTAVGAGGEDSLGAGAVATGTQAASKNSAPAARRNPLMRMTEH